MVQWIVENFGTIGHIADGKGNLPIHFAAAGGRLPTLSLSSPLSLLPSLTPPFPSLLSPSLPPLIIHLLACSPVYLLIHSIINFISLQGR